VSITIHHNPDCGTSRNTLAMIRQSGEEPVVIEYLKTPPTREKLKELIAAMNIPVRALLREKGTPYAQLGLGDAKWTDDELLDCESARVLEADRHVKLLIQFAVEGSLSGAYSHSGQAQANSSAARLYRHLETVLDGPMCMDTCRANGGST
jgi:arsenate reductase (glutaredoxin)